MSRLSGRLVAITRSDGFRAMLRVGGRRRIMGSGLIAFLPAWALAMMVPVVKFLVINASDPMIVPIGILALKIRPVYRMGLIPVVPPGRIPLRRPHNVGGGIGVIRGPAILVAEEVIQDSIPKPIALIVDPGRIGPDIRGGYHDRTRRRHIDLGLRRDWTSAQDAPSCHNRQHKNNTDLFHVMLPMQSISPTKVGFCCGVAHEAATRLVLIVLPQLTSSSPSQWRQAFSFLIPLDCSGLNVLGATSGLGEITARGGR
jgi:hypothetical protein